MNLKIFLFLNIMIIEKMHVGIPNKNKSLSLFHINAYSLNKNFDDLQYLLHCTKNNFDIIGVRE